MEEELIAIYFNRRTIEILKRINAKIWEEIEYLLDEGFFDYVGEARIYRGGNKELRMVNIPKRKKA